MSGVATATTIPYTREDWSPNSTAPVTTQRVTLIPGIGIGPEVVGSMTRILSEAGARIDWETTRAGTREARESMERTGRVFKGPMSKPSDAALRQTAGVHATVCPVGEIPGIRTAFSGRGIDFLLVREHGQQPDGPDFARILEFVARPACEQTLRLAFGLAAAEGRVVIRRAIRSPVAERIREQIHGSFAGVAANFPLLDASCVDQHLLAQQLVLAPEMFDVVMTGGAHDDLISEIAFRLVGGLAVVPSVSRGAGISLFEPVHGPALELAGRDIANPTGAIRSAILLLREVGQAEIAEVIEEALVLTLEQRLRAPMNTGAFTQAVIDNLGCDRWEWIRRAPSEWHRTALPARLA